MAGHDGLGDGEPHSGATGVATGGEERVEYLVPVASEIGSPSLRQFDCVVVVDRFWPH
jgi:hypothetical protein